MGSTFFLGFSCPNLLFVFSEFIIPRNLFHHFSRLLGLSLGLFLFFSVHTLFLVACDHENSCLCLGE